MLGWIVFPIVGYLIGSLSLAPLAARIYGIDLHGSTGAAQLAHLAGVKWGVAGGIFDFLKGFVPVLIARLMGLNDWVIAGTGLAAVCGHIWPLYFGFRGGRGLNTITGVSAFLLPRETAIAFPLAIIIGYLVRRSGRVRAWVDPIPAGAAGGLIGSIMLAWWFREPLPIIIYAVVVASMPMLRGISELTAFIARFGKEGRT